MSAPGCFCTERMTAGSPPTLPCAAPDRAAEPDLGHLPTVIGTGSPVRTTVSAMSSRLVARPTMRMSDSRSALQQEAAAGGRVRPLDGRGQLVERHVVPRQPLRRGEHLVLLQLAAHDGHLGDAPDGQQPVADDPSARVRSSIALRRPPSDGQADQA